jgi:hypothetical protein
VRGTDFRETLKACLHPHEYHEDDCGELPESWLRTYKTQMLLATVFGIEGVPFQGLLQSGDNKVQESPASPNKDLDGEEEEEEKESSESYENPIGDPDEPWEDAGAVDSLGDLTESLFGDLEDLPSAYTGLSAESTTFDLDAIMEREDREAPISTDTTLTIEQEASIPAAQDSSRMAEKRQASEQIGNDAKKRKDSGQDEKDEDTEGGDEIQNCSPQ